jgi:hypothetical protein
MPRLCQKIRQAGDWQYAVATACHVTAAESDCRTEVAKSEYWATLIQNRGETWYNHEVKYKLNKYMVQQYAWQ